MLSAHIALVSAFQCMESAWNTNTPFRKEKTNYRVNKFGDDFATIQALFDIGTVDWVICERDDVDIVLVDRHWP